MTDYSRSYQQFGVGFTDKFNVISGFYYSSWTTGNHPVKQWNLFQLRSNISKSLYIAMWVPPSGCYVWDTLI